jgi:hypothetical protein
MEVDARCLSYSLDVEIACAERFKFYAVRNKIAQHVASIVIEHRSENCWEPEAEVSVC